MGYGFRRSASTRPRTAASSRFSLNFDVVAHEVGHCIVYSVIGVPDPGTAGAEYYGFHESAADLTGADRRAAFRFRHRRVAGRKPRQPLHAQSRQPHRRTVGNGQIRLAANPLSMLDFVRGWRDEHALAQPLTGAMFDIFVDLFHEELVARGLISRGQEDLSDELEDSPDYSASSSRSSTRPMPRRPRNFARRWSLRATRLGMLARRNLAAACARRSELCGRRQHAARGRPDDNRRALAHDHRRRT